MTHPRLITFASTQSQIQTAITAGISEIILEHPNYSIKSRSFSAGDPSKEFSQWIQSQCRLITNANNQIDISVLCDQIFLDQDEAKFINLISELQSNRIHKIRVHDIGLAHFINTHAPDLTCILNLDTQCLNEESFKIYRKYGKIITLSHLLCLEEIQQIIQKAPGEYELLIHGNILLHQSVYPYITQAINPTQTGPYTQTELEIIDQDHPTRRLHALENEHGFAVYNDFQRSLWRFIPELRGLNLSGFIIDTRGDHEAHLAQVIQAYQEILADPAPEKIGSWNQMAKEHKLKPGFFRQAKFDIRKKSKQWNQKAHGSYRGIVIDSKPKKWIWVELDHPIGLGETLTILTPEAKEYQCKITELQNRQGQSIQHTQNERLAKIPFPKTIPVQSIIY